MIKQFPRLLVLLISLAFALPILTLPTACTTPPASRVVQVQTLKSVGETAEAAVTLSAQLYKSAVISPTQARQVLDLYDNKFQPAFRLAVSAAKANLDTLASPDLVSLAAQLTSTVAQFSKSPSP